MTEYVYKLKNGKVIRAYADEKGNISISREALEILVNSWNDGYEKGRADAIDEFANKLIDELHYNVSAKPITINTPYATPIMIDGEIQKIADKLKEQNNE